MFWGARIYIDFSIFRLIGKWKRVTSNSLLRDNSDFLSNYGTNKYCTNKYRWYRIPLQIDFNRTLSSSMLG